jgi:hypothetical protein
MGWCALGGAHHSALPCALDQPRVTFTTSGRAAILLALEALGVLPGDRVLLPTYHCPTMVAPAAALGADALFYPIDDRGTPDLQWLSQQPLQGVRVMLAAHYFGLPQPMNRVRQWCDAQGIALIEDCAHAMFGSSAGQPIGSWGDLAICSLTKFFPVPEGGCVVLNRAHRLAGTPTPCGPVLQVKAIVDILEVGAQHGRLAGLNGLIGGGLSLMRKLPRHHGTPQADAPPPARPPVHSGDFELDVSLARRAVSAPSQWVARALPRDRIVRRRRRHYERLHHELNGEQGYHPLLGPLPADCAPYVFPLWVDSPDPSYAELRRLGIPVFRWDRLWHSVSTLPDDQGLLWSHHVLQFACHQDLGDDDLTQMITAVRHLCAAAPQPNANLPPAA